VKQILFLISFVCFLSVVNAQNGDFRADYLDRFRPLAIAEHLRTGIPASITMAQAIIESDWGRSRLATEAKNHFGIKCHTGWDRSMAVYEDDDEKNECFRKYLSHDRSFVDHSAFLKTRPRYAFLFDIPNADYKKWAKGLKTAGYATNPKYPSILIDLIERYSLAELDDIDLAQLQEQNPYYGSYKYLEQSEVQKTDPLIQKPSGSAQYVRDVRLLNKRKYVRLKEGDGLHQIAEAFGLKTERIYKYNDLSPAFSVYAGMKVFIQAKRNKGKSRYHSVGTRETLWQISQDHGIKLKKLYKRNLLPYGVEVEPGQRVYLKSTASFPPRIRMGSVNYGRTKMLQEPVSREEVIKDAPQEEKVRAKPETHIVKKGETLYSISQKYYIPLEKLKALNGLEGNDLSIGMVLKLR
jgi:LysM repeat protein